MDALPNSRLAPVSSSYYLSTFEKGGALSYDEEAAFCEHVTMHELPDMLPASSRRKVRDDGPTTSRDA